MTAREKLCIRILLIVCHWLAPYGWRKDIETIQAFAGTTLSAEKPA